MRFFGPKEIKSDFQAWVDQNRESFRGKKVLDLPAGSGQTAEIFYNLGAEVTAADLLPEFYKFAKVPCDEVDLGNALPYPDQNFDVVICQEGLEHISDQAFALRELGRVLKLGGRLVITTPNYSSLRSRLSYLFNESELMGKILPPNEVEGIWFASNEASEYYFGHTNLIGIQRLRLFAKLAGLDLQEIHSTRVNNTALFAFPLLYPFIWYFSRAAYRRLRRKQGAEIADSLLEVYKLSVSPKVLLQSHLLVEFVKTKEKFVRTLKLAPSNYGITT